MSTSVKHHDFNEADADIHSLMLCGLKVIKIHMQTSRYIKLVNMTLAQLLQKIACQLCTQYIDGTYNNPVTLKSM